MKLLKKLEASNQSLQESWKRRLFDLQVAEVKEVVLVDEQISRINIQINAIDGQIPVKLFGLLNEFLDSGYLKVYPVSSEKKVDSRKLKINEALCRLEQMEA